MGALDFQLGVKNEVTYGTRVVVDRFFEYDSESIEDIVKRTEGDPLRVGSRHKRSDRFTPWYGGAQGNITMAVLSKGFGFWLPHMLGQVATTGPTDSRYVHTGSEASLIGDMFTCQVNRPFHPSGTNQAITFGGGKVTSWELSNSVDGNLMLDLGVFFANQTTGTALATASYPTSMEPLTWVGGVVTIGGSAYDLTEFSVQQDNGYNTERQQIRGNTETKEPTAGAAEASFAFKADFDSLAQRDRALATTRAGAIATVSATWTAPTLIGAATYPELTVSFQVGRWDDWKGATGGREAIEQEVSGVVRYDGSTSPVSVIYRSADVTA